MSIRSKIAFVYLLGFAIDLANMFVINAAYPMIQRGLHASVAQLAWIGNAYMLGLTVVIPLGTWLARRFGERRVLAASLLLFGIASAGAAVAPTPGVLIAWRLVQGLSGGLLIPVGQAMTYRAYPPERRAHLTSIVMMVALLVPALSPALGGVLADHASWRWIFAGMLPPAMIACVLALAWLPADTTTDEPAVLDLRGLLSSALALIALLFGLTLVGMRGAAPVGIAALTLSFAFGFAYVRHARHATVPLIDLRLLAQPLLRVGIVVYWCVPGVFTGVNLVAALYLQGALGMSATQTGALMVPWAAASFLAIATTRRTFFTLGPKMLLTVGIALECIGIALLATPLVTHGAGRVLAFAAMGFGGSLCSSTAQSAAFLEVLPGRMGDASALWNLNRQLSFCIGSALLANALSFLLSFGESIPAPLCYRYCFLFGAALTLLPLALVGRLASPSGSQALVNSN